MKDALSWFRWVLLVPAFFVGLGLGPLLVTFLLIISRVDWGDGRDAVFYIGLGSSSFGVTLFCAWVAPCAKRMIGVTAATLCLALGLVLNASIPDSGGHPEFGWGMLGIWPLLGSYGLGAALALLYLFSILRRRADRSSATA